MFNITREYIENNVVNVNLVRSRYGIKFILRGILARFPEQILNQ